MAEKKGGILKWLLLLGCGGVLLVTLVCGGFGLMVFLGVRTAMQQSVAYQEALSLAREHPDVEDLIGSPIEEGFLTSGSIDTSGGKTDVDIAIPVSGPKGEGKIYVKGTCYGGADCEYSDLSFVAKGERIDLLE